jgi:hypothetical protein
MLEHEVAMFVNCRPQFTFRMKGTHGSVRWLTATGRSF